jgi:hypothetical protein
MSEREYMIAGKYRTLLQASRDIEGLEARVAELEKRLDEDADALRSLGAQVARLKHLPVPDPAIAKKEAP